MKTKLAVAAVVLGAMVAPVAATAQMAPPAVKAHLYDDSANPDRQLKEGLAQAKREGKRVIVDFGGDWCGDCQVLDIYMRRQPNLQLAEKHFVVLHISVGHMDKNLDFAQKLGVPISKGVPALAVLDANGKVLYSQKTGEFESMRTMNERSVTEFLTKWKA